MAVIGKIRKQSTFLLIAIGGAMVLFVLGDLLTGNSVFLTGPDTEVGEINGTKISYAEYEQRLQQALAMQFPTTAPTEQQREQVREQVWADFVRDYAMQPEFNALGIGVSDNEMFDVIKNDPSNPMLRQYFTNPQTGQVYEQFRNQMGMLDADAVINYFKQVLTLDPSSDANAAGARMSYILFKKSLRESLEDEKYNTMLQKGLYVPAIQVEMLEQEKAKQVSFSYALKYYSSLPDSTFEPSESEMKAYYNAHKNDPRFDQEEPSRSLDYVVFNVGATPEDVAQTEAELNEVKDAFINSVDDTLFVNETGDTPFNFRWVKAGDLPASVDSLVMTGEKNAVFGPVKTGNKFALYKIKESKVAPDSAKARHILIQVNGADTSAARGTIDSLKAAIQGGADFAELAQTYSADPGSASNGGDLGWFTEGQMVKPFNDAAFEGKAGDMKIVLTQFGYHLIEVQEQTAPVQKVYVAIVDNVVEPSEATYQAVYGKASTFRTENKDGGEAYENAADEFGLMQAPGVRAADRTLMGLENSRQIVRWAFEAELGEVSTVFDLGDQYVVARLVEVREKGLLPFEQVKDIVRTEVLKEKKAEQIMKDLAGVSSLEEAASAMGGMAIQQVPALTFDAFSIPGIGSEPELIGKIFTVEAGKMSVPLAGDNGVYVVQVNNYVDVPADGTARTQLERNYASRVAFEASQAVREKAGIEDKRASFY